MKFVNISVAEAKHMSDWVLRGWRQARAGSRRPFVCGFNVHTLRATGIQEEF